MLKIIVFIISFIISAGITYLNILFSRRIQLIDVPNKRSSHSTPKPRGGGLGIVLIMLCIFSILVFLGFLPFQYMFALFLGGAIVAGVGFWDDFKGHIDSKIRIIIHILVAFIGVFLLSGFEKIIFGPWEINLNFFGILIGGFFVVSFINIYNFMDGIDGISGIEAMFFSIGTFLLLYITQENMIGINLFLITIAGVNFGFLIWNWEPSKIFLGDVGSGFLGYIIAMTIIFLTNLDFRFFWPLMILIGVYLVDTAFTLLFRVINKERWFEAHRKHGYQKAVIRFGSHKKVVIFIALINCCWLLPLAYFALKNPSWGLGLLLIAYLPLIFLCWKIGAGKNETGI